MDIESLTDVTYEVDQGLAWITINRPHRYNAFTGLTVNELLLCFQQAWHDPDVGVIALTGSGDKAFCAGGDKKEPADLNRLTRLQSLHGVMRDIPKPTIAAVNGFAIGGGHVLQVLCDFAIAADHARFGQAGPRIGSWDGGLGTGILARHVGERRAKEMWFLCRQYDAETMYRWGLVNAVVPMAELRSEVRRFADDLLTKSPTALKFLKHSFHADSESLKGVARLAFDGLELFADTAESREGKQAFTEKRAPKYR